MAKKLVLDRPINLTIKDDSTVTVPADEVWKVSATIPGNSLAELNDVRATENSTGAAVRNLVLGGGAKIKGLVGLTGIAFKLVEV